jgi:hypothetical protein
MKKELVIAAYDNYLDWLNDINHATKITVYRKGDYTPQRYDEIKIDINKGRCVHTFFNHLYLNYNNLSDITYFAQDYPFDHWEDIINVINNETQKSKCQLNIGGYYGFHYNTITVPSIKGGIMWDLNKSKQHGNGNILICQSNGQPQDNNPNINVDKYWDILFTDKKPLEYEFIPGGHFGITKEHVKLRPKEFYKKICDLLLEEESAPWNIERLECYIFNPTYK